jgi:hypothetical protein
MANDSYSQQALAADPRFQTRVRASLANVAWQVLEEATTVPGHAQRIAYANTVINNLAWHAQQITSWLVMRPNLMAFETAYNFAAGAVVTAAGDADIESQLLTDWNEIAGVDPTKPLAMAAPIGPLPPLPPPQPPPIVKP